MSTFAKSKGSVDIGAFTKIPNKFFSSGTASAIGASASLFYLALCENANRNSSTEFKASDRAISSETGLGTRTIIDARKRLLEKGLISCVREKGESYVYTLLKLELSWVRLKDRPRADCKPRAYYVIRTEAGQRQKSSSANLAERVA